jgi:imidazolonepropionase-like amidohydrolase
MDSERVLTGQTILIQGGWITALGPAGKVHVPAGAKKIDVHGQYLIPGLSDMHVHLGLGMEGESHEDGTGMDDYSERVLFRYIGYGATTIRILDYGWPTWGEAELRLRARQAAGEILSPRIYATGAWGPMHYINMPGSSGPPPRLDSIAIYVAAFKAVGYDLIKAYHETPVVLDSLVTAARRLGLPVTGHIPEGTTIEQAIQEGYTGIEHPITEYYNRRPGSVSDSTTKWADEDSHTRALAELMRRNGVWNCPTLAHYEGAVQGHQHGGPGAWARYRRSVKILHDAGVGLLLGTDNQAGIGMHLELQALVDAGLTPFQALETGTRNVAKYFGTLNESGTVTVGKRADLVLLKDNPLVNIRNTTGITGVMLGGRWLPGDMIKQRLQQDSLKLRWLGGD